jgi:predicted nuclease of predicted toxin-antitoxin system
VAGLPLLTDNHVRQPIIKALQARGWDVVRAVDVFGEENVDEELLAWAAANARVFVTSDHGVHATAHKWLREGRAFRMIYWWAEHRRRMSDGEVVQALERLAARYDAFTYAIEYIKPER